MGFGGIGKRKALGMLDFKKSIASIKMMTRKLKPGL
jgi:hypothetical protein